MTRLSPTVVSVLGLISALVSVESTLYPTPAHAESGPGAIAYITPQDTFRSQAHGLYQSSQFAQALVLYHQLCSSGQATAADWYWLGESYAHTDQFQSAAKAFEETLKLDPSNEKARVRLVEAHLSARRPDLAKEVARTALGMVTTERAKQQLTMLNKICSMPMPEPQRKPVSTGVFSNHNHKSTER